MMRTLKARYGAALTHREFRYLLSAFQVSLLGDSVAYIAVTVLIYRRTGSPLLAALVFTVAFTPYLVGGTLLSALVDRIPPRRLLVTADLAAAVLALAMAAGRLPVGLLLGLLFALSLLAPVTQGSRTALVADICAGDAYVPASSLLRISAQGSQVFGNALGGALLIALSPRGALGIDAATFVISATLTRIGLRHRPATGNVRGGTVVGDSLAGVRRVLAQPAIRRVLIFSWLVPFISTAPEALAAPAVSQLHLASSWVGWWLVGVPTGTIVGDVLGIWLVPPGLWRRLAWPLGLALAAVLIAFAADPSIPVALVLLAAVGALSCYGLAVQQLLLDVTPFELRGRTLALSTTGLMVGQGLGFVTAGAVAELLSAHLTIAVFGAAGLVAIAVLGRPEPRTDRGGSGDPAQPDAQECRPTGPLHPAEPTS